MSCSLQQEKHIQRYFHSLNLVLVLLELGKRPNKVLIFSGRIAFEKLTDFDYRGNTYYTVKNLSLYECQGWCREEPDCQAAAFSFVLNPLIPVQVKTTKNF